MITLIKSYPYDNNYDYTKMFATSAEQSTYFNSLGSIDVAEHNYIKVNDSFNVNYEFDYLQNEGVNYVIFDNGYINIYAFIVKKEFVRKEVTRLIYEVDVLQTFMFNFNTKNSFIERKACSISELTDFDEGLNFGNHKIVSDTTVFEKGATYFAMFKGFKNFEVTTDTNGKITHYAEIPSSNNKPSTSIDGINYPLFFMPLSTGNVPNIIADHPSLVGIVRFPSCTYTTQEIKIPFLTKLEDNTGYFTSDFLTNVADTITSTTHSGSGGSVAKGEVVDFFPYTFYVLTDGEGEPLVMQPQDLPSSISVVGKYALSHQPIERFYVEGYKGDNSGKVFNITNTNQMMLPTGTSEGMAYISANGASMKMSRDNQVVDNVINGISTVASAVATNGMSLAFGGVGSVVSGINKVREADQRTKDIMATPSSISSYGTPSTRVAFGTNSVRVLKYTISDLAKNKIRNFISRYGNKYNNYATIDLKTYKGYIKFISPDIDSTIDNIYISKINEILERGIYIE